MFVPYTRQNKDSFPSVFFNVYASRVIIILKTSNRASQLTWFLYSIRESRKTMGCQLSTWKYCHGPVFLVCCQFNHAVRSNDIIQLAGCVPLHEWVQVFLPPQVKSKPIRTLFPKRNAGLIQPFFLLILGHWPWPRCMIQFTDIHSSPKEMQLSWTCVSFVEECIR